MLLTKKLLKNIKTHLVRHCRYKMIHCAIVFERLPLLAHTLKDRIAASIISGDSTLIDYALRLYLVKTILVLRLPQAKCFLLNSLVGFYQ